MNGLYPLSERMQLVNGRCQHHIVKEFAEDCPAKDRSSTVYRVDCLEAAVGRLFAGSKLFYSRYMVGATTFVAVSAKIPTQRVQVRGAGEDELSRTCTRKIPSRVRTLCI